jgi:hypothetical protein
LKSFRALSTLFGDICGRHVWGRSSQIYGELTKRKPAMNRLPGNQWETAASDLQAATARIMTVPLAGMTFVSFRRAENGLKILDYVRHFIIGSGAHPVVVLLCKTRGSVRRLVRYPDFSRLCFGMLALVDRFLCQNPSSTYHVCYFSRY